MNKTIICKYNSVGEMSAKLNAANATKYFEGRERSKLKGGYYSGTETYDEADNLLLYGDKELQKLIEEAGVSKMRTKLTGKGTRREIYSSVAGFAAHVPNYITGVPTSMLNVRQKRTAVPVIDLYYNLSANYTQKAEEIAAASAKVIAAAMKIEASGIRLNIHTVNASHVNGDYVVSCCKIKSSGQTFDTLKMAYPMAHPSMLRRHFLRHVEVTKGVKKAFVAGYGAAAETAALRNIFKDNRIKDNRITADNAKVISYEEAKQMTIDEIVKSIAG